jgi:hypothetical protein
MTAVVYATELDDAATAQHAKAVIAAQAGTELLHLFKRAGEADD